MTHPLAPATRLGSKKCTAEAGLSHLVLFVFVVALLLLPIVGHGCHGDDVDHEPHVKPIESRSSSER
jgi:hypothetical protein